MSCECAAPSPWHAVGTDTVGARPVGSDVSNNQLSGPVPHALGDLSSLTLLDLSNNAFSGTIPPALHKLDSVEAMCVMVVCSGGLGVMTDVHCRACRRDLGYNSFTGSVPPGFATSNNLRELRLNNNLLSGELPAAFGENLHFNSTNGLYALDLSMNDFCGLLPTGLGNITVGAAVDGIVMYARWAWVWRRVSCSLCSVWVGASGSDFSHNRFNPAVPPEVKTLCGEPHVLCKLGMQSGGC